MLVDVSSVRSGVILLIKGIGHPLKVGVAPAAAHHPRIIGPSQCLEYELEVTFNHTQLRLKT